MRLKIVSGGQTGVDRGALDAALDRGSPCGGWCPEGRTAEDGIIPGRYPVEELPGAGPDQRTRRNVTDSDASLIVTCGTPGGGTAETLRQALLQGRPCHVADLEAAGEAAVLAAVQAWLSGLRVRVLNVAGPRASQWPQGGEAARRLVGALLDSHAAGAAGDGAGLKSGGRTGASGGESRR